MQGQLKVNPQDLINTATDFNARGQNVANLTQEMLSLVAGLKGGWEGDASGAYTRKFAELSGDIEQIRNKIKEHTEDLREMARTYENAERQNTEAHAALSSNLID